MATVTITPAITSATAGTIHPSTTQRLMRGARLPVTQHEGTWHDSPHTEGRFRSHTRPLNPTGEGRVMIQNTTAALFRSSSNEFQSIVADTNKYGGTLTYTPTGGTAIAYEIVEMNLGDPETDFEQSETRAVFPFSFECRPYGMLPSQSVSFTGGALTGPVDYIDVPDVAGQVDALGVLELTDTSTQNRDYVEYGLEMTGYSSGAPTDLILSFADLNATGLAGASNAGLTGDYSGNVYRASVFTSPISICSTGTQTHQGKRRIRARVAGIGTGPIYVRLAWRVGDGPWEHNNWVQLNGLSVWLEPSLGSIYVPPGETWEGRIEAKSETNLDTVDVDVIFPMPAERWGRSGRLVKSQTTTVLSGYDTFLHAAGDLTGKVMPLGGTWAEAGDAVGLVLDTTNDWVTRTEVSDGATFTSGHFALAGTTDYTATQVEVAIKTSQFHGFRMGLVARYVDASNFMVAYVKTGGGTAAEGVIWVYVYKVVAGVETQIGNDPVTRYLPAGTFRKLKLDIDVAGRWSLDLATNLGANAEAWTPSLSGQDTVLATGGALAAGQAGIWDHHDIATASTRYYDNFMVSAPPAAERLGAMFSGQSMRFTYDSCERENSAGTRWGAAPNFVGQHLLIPPAGRGDRISRIAVLARRYDVDDGQPSDGLSDGMTATLNVTPRVLLTGP